MSDTINDDLRRGLALRQWARRRFHDRLRTDMQQLAHALNTDLMYILWDSEQVPEVGQGVFEPIWGEV